MLSISLNFKKGIDALSETIHQPKIKKWLMGLLVAIPLLGIGSYVAYNLKNIQPQTGVFFRQADLDTAKPVVVLGSKVRNDLFTACPTQTG